MKLEPYRLCPFKLIIIFELLRSIWVLISRYILLMQWVELRTWLQLLRRDLHIFQCIFSALLLLFILHCLLSQRRLSEGILGSSCKVIEVKRRARRRHVRIFSLSGKLLVLIMERFGLERLVHSDEQSIALRGYFLHRLSYVAFLRDL